MCKPRFAQSFGTCHYSWLCTVRSTKHWNLSAGNIQVPYKADNSLTWEENVNFLNDWLYGFICLLNKYFVVFLWLSFVVWVRTLNSWTLWMHEEVIEVLCLWCAIELTHTLDTYTFTVAHFGNRLQNMFYRQCPVFSTSVSYTTLRIFDLNVWSSLCSRVQNVWSWK